MEHFFTDGVFHSCFLAHYLILIVPDVETRRPNTLIDSSDSESDILLNNYFKYKKGLINFN